MQTPFLVQHTLIQAATRHPETTAVACGASRTSYRELRDRSTNLASDMRFRGLSRGDRVLVLLPSCPATAISIFGTLLAGGTFSVLSSSLKPGKLASILRNSEPAFVVTDARGLRQLSSLPDLLPRIGVYVTGEAPPDAISFESTSRRRRPESSPVQVDLDLAAIIYTSGTTSTPKGVALSHRNMLAAARSIQAYLGLRPDDRILDVLPLSFDYGLYQLLLSVQSGATLILRDGLGFPFEILRTIHERRVTVLPCVPTMVAILLRMAPGDALDLSSVKTITSTGAALPASFLPGLARMFPSARIFSMYGLTECKRVSWMPPEELAAHPDSVGRAMPNTEVYVVDEAGQWHDRDATGELVVRGSNVMCGYFRDPEATAQALRPGLLPGESALFTGDLFRIDAQGYLYFLGRRDEVFKSRGERVSPREIEVALYGIEGVTAARVSPVPDPVLGNAIRAEVVCDRPLTPDRVIAHCRSRLEDRLVPRDVHIVDELPVSEAGKVRGRSG
jgi:long-chain acyl-CoA synthetase